MLKLLLMVQNSLFLVFGGVIIGVGLYFSKTDAAQIASKSLPLAIVVAGGFVMFVALIGCCGARKQNRFLLGLYVFILVLVVLLQLILGIIVVANQDSVRTFANDKWIDYYTSDNPDDQQVLLDLESSFDCCGLQRNATNDLTYVVHGTTVCPAGDPKTAAADGCLDKLDDKIKEENDKLGILVMVLAGLQILGIIFAVLLRRSIHKHEFGDAVDDANDV
eukprot:TRINITY_DN63311_c0_g1_i2.p2 TRINITY_DN63311_c0_g1~~TRINITY_DN63311_c0_g1_i2.p2  ORF type:complete len:220 (-),score=133.77 TRINITY_DN63311_c0_g1_i2:178-837(-)